ncbi:MAG: hypothetical protein CVV13_09810 [Gammaproteobacteria bacterium HGW-Gammaproteobacteria-3]|nr:MAG: hypothetical protein CVV13_09810 [Gammaproteobacteria bacterium HGW-Gammaproteobacteria-3]
MNYVTVCTKRRSWLTPLTYILVGNAEGGQKTSQLHKFIKCTFLSSVEGVSRISQSPLRLCRLSPNLHVLMTAPSKPS